MKTTPMSSLVAVYWRVEEVVDKPVGGSILVLLEMTTAAGGRRKSVDVNRRRNEMLQHCGIRVFALRSSV